MTALDAQVLPAAAQFTGNSLVSAEIANVTCGPNSRVDGLMTARTVLTARTDPTDLTARMALTVPTCRPRSTRAPPVAGTVSTSSALIGGLLMLGGAAGLVGYRRLLGR